MNLYRSFGNLMETWVTEETPCHEPPWTTAKDPPSEMGTNLRSESVDSGVETASCDTFLSAAGSVSTDSPDSDLFSPQRGLSPLSTSQSPVLSSPAPSSSSSSSPQFCPSRANEGSTSSHPVGGQTLQTTESLHLQDKPKPLTVEDVLNRRPRAPEGPKRHSADLAGLVRSQRTQSLEPRWRVNPRQPVRQMSDLSRRPVSMNCDKDRPEGVAVADRKSSPGLDYLEQVCQMLEGIARQQMLNRGLQPEMEALWEDQDAQAPDGCQSDSSDDEDDLSSHQRLDNTGNAEEAPSEPQRRKYGHFRQRSASDTALSTLHLRKLHTRDRAQILSTNDLLESAEEHQEKLSFQESTTTETTKSHKGWRLKFASLGKVESSIFSTKSQQTQSSEKKSARRRLSQLFKRRKTLPM